MVDYRYFALMPSGVSQIRSTLKDACADAIFDIKNGYATSYAIYKVSSAKVVFAGIVEKKGTAYKFVIPGSSSKALNRNGSFRKSPEPKPFLR